MFAISYIIDTDLHADTETYIILNIISHIIESYLILLTAIQYSFEKYTKIQDQNSSQLMSI